MQRKLLYMEIAAYIQNKIRNGEWKPDDLLPSEAELSQQFNVSRITAQKALEDLKEKNLIYRIQGKGSFVSSISRGDKNFLSNSISKPDVIALVMPFAGSYGNGMEVIHGVTDILNERGYYLTLHISNYSSAEEKKIINKLISDDIRGIILYPVSHSQNIDLIYGLLLDNYPIVTIDKYFDAFPVSSVVTDNFKGGYIAASHLIDLGHRETVFIADDKIESATSIRDRYFGFRSAMKDNSIEVKDDSLICIENLCNNESKILQSYSSSEDNLLDPFKKVIDELMHRRKTCTAIQAVNDYTAILLLKSAISLGVKVPEELSIIGFDNIDNCAYLEVPLTTVEQKFYSIGEEAAKLVINKIDNACVGYERMNIPVSLIKRSSTAAARPQ